MLGGGHHETLKFNANDELLDALEPLEQQGYVKRMIVVDAANVMHAAMSPEFQREMERTRRGRVDASALVVLIHYFYSKGFDVHCFSNGKYASEKCVQNHQVVSKLEEMGLYNVLPDSTFDDFACLSFCGDVDGVVLSRDRYKAERKTSDRIKYLTDHRVLVPEFTYIRDTTRQWRTPDDLESELISTFTMELNASLDQLREMLYCKPTDLRYEIVKETRERWAFIRQVQHMVDLQRLYKECQSNHFFGLQNGPRPRRNISGQNRAPMPYVEDEEEMWT